MLPVSPSDLISVNMICTSSCESLFNTALGLTLMGHIDLWRKAQRLPRSGLDRAKGALQASQDCTMRELCWKELYGSDMRGWARSRPVLRHFPKVSRSARECILPKRISLIRCMPSPNSMSASSE